MSVISEPRFFIEHDTIHDRETGRHVRTKPDDGFEDGITACCDLLNGLSDSVRNLKKERATLRMIRFAMSEAKRETTGFVLKDKADGTYAMAEDDAWTPHRADALRFASRDAAVEELARGEYVHTVRIVRLVKR